MVSARRAATLELEPRVVAVGEASVFHYDVGDGPAVVMLHGFNHHAEAFVRNVAALAEAGHRVVVPDLPGFGRSGMPPISYSLPGYAAFMVAFLDALGIERANLVGSSMGGAIALRVAIDHPDRVLSVCAVDPAGMFEEVPKLWAVVAHPMAKMVIRPFMGHRRLMEESHRRAYHDPTHFSRRQTDLMAEAWAQPGYKDHILGIAEAMFLAPAEEHLWEGLPRIAAPVLVVWGRQDRTLPLSHAYRAAQRMPAAELVVYDRCGHLPMYEKADEFNRDLLDFLARHS